jgi:pimeloyl-ACP methyl ester carboxylesterase
MKTSQEFISTDYQDALFTQVSTNSDKPSRTFIFVHGLAGDSNAYSQLTEEVLKILPDSRCVAYDLRGYGHSTYHMPDEEYFLVHAKDLLSLVNVYRSTPVIVLGQSMGANIAAYFINCFPDQLSHIEKFFLIGLVPSNRALISSKLPSHLITKYVQSNVQQKKKRTVEEILKYKNSFDYSLSRTYGDVKHFGLKKYLLYWLPIFSWQNKEWKQEALRKIIYIYGKKDILIPKAFHKRFIARYSDIKYYELNTNHNAVVNSPEEVADIIRMEVSS